MSEDRKIATTRYEPWVEVKCVQECGWKPEKPGFHHSTAARHFKETGHEVAVITHSSVHYHRRSE